MTTTITFETIDKILLALQDHAARNGLDIDACEYYCRTCELVTIAEDKVFQYFLAAEEAGEAEKDCPLEYEEKAEIFWRLKKLNKLFCKDYNLIEYYINHR